MSTFLVVCGQQVDIQRRVVTFLEQGAPNFYAEKEATGLNLYSNRPGVPQGAGLDVVKEKVWMVCIHHDATWDSLSCYNVLKNRGLSSHLFIDGNGLIYQPIDIRENTWHAGEVNNFSVGVDMNNVADPRILQETDRGREYAKARGGLITGKINGANITSCGYTEEQYNSLVAVILGLHKVLPKINLFPPLDQNGEVIDRKILNYEAFQGFCGHMHVSASKWDPGPGFDWQRVMVGLHGERNSFPVSLPNVKDLKDVFSSADTERVAQAFYENNESGESGFYPISTSQAWSSGVHLNISAGQPVMSMSRGQIIAVRNTPPVELGSPNFVLIKHVVRTAPPPADGDAKPAEGDKDAEESYIERPWYALYMHTQYIDEKTPLDRRPAWHRSLGQDETLGGEVLDVDVGAADDIDRRPKVGKTFRDLRAGKIVLMDYPVKAAEVIGYVGSFGEREELLRDVVHVSAFSTEEEPLFEPSEFPGTWKLIEADPDNDSLVDIEQIWRPIVERTEIFADETVEKRGERILTPAEIREFFVTPSPEKEIMRGFVCRHVSEWSDKIDWRKTAALAVGWQWETQEAYERFLHLWAPFQWMNGELVDYAALDKEHKIWTYHPVTLISWFHANYGKQLSPEEYQQGFSNAALVEQRKLEEIAAQKGQVKQGWHGDKDTDAALITAEITTELDTTDDPWEQWEQGEWPPDDSI